MKQVALKPPLGLVALIVAVLSLLGSVMGFLIASRVLGQSLHSSPMEPFLTGMRALAPLGIVFSLLWGYIKWFVYSAILHLASDLLGGRGSARGVFAATGLAGIPSILMIPLQLLAYWFGNESTFVTILVGLASLAVLIWVVALLLIGLKQVHGISTGRSVLAVLSPLLALIALGILLIVTLVAIAASIPARMHYPGYF